MPQTLSAKRALRVDRRREAINKLIRQKIKKALSLARKKPTGENLTQAVKILARAAQKGVIHKNKASRLKSRLAKLAPKTTLKKKTSPTKKGKRKD